MKLYELLKLILSKKEQKKISFKEKFLHFQELLNANNLAHKYMSELIELLALEKPFSRSKSTNLYNNLFIKTEEIVHHLNYLGQGKYKNLEVQFRKIAEICNKMLSPRIFCIEHWNCNDKECYSCNKVKRIDNNIPFYFNLKDIDISHSFEVGSKMSRLGEIKNNLNIPVPNGFCLSVRLFEEIMTNDNLRDKKNQIFSDVDFEDIKQIQKASRETQQLFISTPIPQKIEDIILEAYDKTFNYDPSIRVAVRSSAIGEDSENFSFAGLHQTILNVSRKNLVDACYEVLISKYSPQSLVYRYFSGIRDEDMPMSVGCIEMINPYCAGVIYTYDINNNNNNFLINTVKGLGSIVVEGRAKPQVYIISRETNDLIYFDMGQQKQVNILKESDGVFTQNITNNQNQILTQEMINTLVGYSLIIEKHFNSPQDIEFAIDNNGIVYILQSRPLQIAQTSNIGKTNYITVEELDKKYNLILKGGDCASKGIGYGNVFIIKRLIDIANCPKNSILVAKKNLPEFTSIIHKLSGVITETGSTTGHLSIIARELGVPILINVDNATNIFHDGMNVTLFAEANRVYEGFIDNKDITNSKLNASNDNLFIRSPLYKLFRQISRYIFTLNLTNPNSNSFKPEFCQTIHDIIRYAHESAMKEMFSLYENAKTDSGVVYKLKFEVPLDIYIIDLGDGLEVHPNSLIVKKEDIKSKPFKSLIQGMTTSGIQWSGPLPVDFKGFINIMIANINDSYKSERQVGSRSYALISHNYLNFFSRLGYHFSRLDAFASEEINKNYINFHFRGGAADPIRRNRRVTVIQRILEEYGFSISRIHDSLVAIIRKTNEEQIYKLLSEIGRLMGAVRNTDVILTSDEHIDIFIKAFLEGDPAPAKKLSN